MYLIPRNISKQFEFFPGFGWHELFVLVFFAGIGMILALLLGLISRSPARFLVFLFFVAAGYMATRPIMADGSSALQILKHMQRYKQGQKRYLYYRKGGM